MGSGYSGLYPTLGASSFHNEVSNQANNPIAGVDYNSAGSSEVDLVTEVSSLKMGEKMPVTSSPNSVAQKKNGDEAVTERYFNSNGEPYLDIDYTDHGNPKTHPVVPHKHDISYNNGKFRREEPGKEIV